MVLSDDEQDVRLLQLMEIVNGQSPDAMRPYLEATDWDLEQAVQLYFADAPAAPAAPAATATATAQPHSRRKSRQARRSPAPDGDAIMDDYVRPPLPVVNEALYDDMMGAVQRFRPIPNAPAPVDAFRNFEDEFKPDNQAGGSSNKSLASLYRPPHGIMFPGTFDQAKAEAERQGKWLMVNVQSHTEFASHMLNRDTWAHEAVKETVSTCFIFWQTFEETEDGQKVQNYYRLERMPAILIVDPLTGQKMRHWYGNLNAERLLEDLLPFLDGGPRENKVPPAYISKDQDQLLDTLRSLPRASSEDEELERALVASLESSAAPMKVDKPEPEPEPELRFPDLPEEPRAPERVCRVGIIFPDGTRNQRNYLPSDPLAYLWSFCCNKYPEARGFNKKFHLAVPGPKRLEYSTSVTMEEAGVANTMVRMAWD